MTTHDDTRAPSPSAATTASLPRTERPDAPAYLTRHLARRANPTAPAPDATDDETPLYLRRFRERDHHTDEVIWDGNVIGTSRAWADVTPHEGDHPGATGPARRRRLRRVPRAARRRRRATRRSPA